MLKNSVHLLWHQAHEQTQDKNKHMPLELSQLLSGEYGWEFG